MIQRAIIGQYINICATVPHGYDYAMHIFDPLWGESSSLSLASKTLRKHRAGKCHERWHLLSTKSRSYN